jgi:hypothetical protein
MAKQIVSLYGDLIDGTDAGDQQLVADLHAFFNPAVPSRLRAAPPLVVRRNIYASWRWTRTALVAALAIFALVGATYVALPLLQLLWASDRGLAHVANAGLVRDIDAVQTIDGVTVHLQRAYADANRVVVGYAVEFPKSVRSNDSHATPMAGEVTLADAEGRQYRGMTSMFAGTSALAAQSLSFEGPGSANAPRDTTYTLSIAKVFSGTTPGAKSTDPFYPAAKSGPWVFTFTLATVPARVVTPSLALTSGDLSLAFTRIVVAPSATRFEYRVTRSGTAVTGTLALIVNGRPLQSAGQCESDGKCFLLTTEPLYDTDVLGLDAVLIIPGGQGPEGAPAQRRINGPILLPLR